MFIMSAVCLGNFLAKALRVSALANRKWPLIVALNRLMLGLKNELVHQILPDQNACRKFDISCCLISCSKRGHWE